MYREQNEEYAYWRKDVKGQPFNTQKWLTWNFSL